MGPLAPHEELRFSGFALQPHQRRLWVDGQPAALGARAFDLLLALVTRPGQLMTKGELLDEVWPGLVVEEANLPVQISALRKVLGGELIATIPGRGYRFTGLVEVVTPPVQAGGGDGAAETAPAPPSDAAARRAAPAGPGPWGVQALIGRNDELATLGPALANPGCLTLVGPAGVGKTALARALATRQAQGAVWVDLAPLTADEQVLAAVSVALGTELSKARNTDQLCATLGARLLVIDNCEHVVDAAAALVSALLQAGPGVRVLATSQLRLAVAGEHVHRVEPLELPRDSDGLDLHRGAVALFVERVRAADHRFEATPAQSPLLREICVRLDGLPLALEMAAARVPLLGLTGLAQALERRFALLTGGRRDTAGRHRTLQAALDWSHDLLTPEEQRLYRLCGVFAGGFTLELLVDVVTAADGAAGLPGEARWAVIETLAQLVDRSLVAVGEGDPPRYRLLETMRDDASLRLAAAGEAHDARRRLLAALARLGHRCIEADRTNPALRELLLAERDSLREAIAWARQQPDPALRADTVTTATAAAQVATFSNWRLDAMHWLELCEPLAEGPGMPASVRVRWWIERSRQWLISKHKDARALAERTLALARECGDELVQFNALAVLVRAPGDDHPELQPLCEAMRGLLARHPEWGVARAFTLAGAEARACDHLCDHEGLLRCRLRELDLARQLGDAHVVTIVETNVVFALQALGRHAEALARARELLDRLRDSEVANAAYASLGLVVSLRALGYFQEFRAALPRAAHLLRLHGLPLLAPQCALLLAAEERWRDALRVLGHARARYAAKGMVMIGDELKPLAVVESQARALWGDAAVELCLAEGATLDEAAVDAITLRATAPPPR